MNELVKTDAQEIMEAVISKGDLSKLTPAERNTYYDETCRSVGLNPLTRPFEYITLQGKQTLYARRDACDQLRKIHGVSVKIISRELKEGMFIVHVHATDSRGREDEDLGVVPMGAGASEIRANQIMKAITKAKRRVTLSICGLGFPDESEIEDALKAEAKGPRKVKTITPDDKPKELEHSPVPLDPADKAAPGLTSPNANQGAGATNLSEIEEQLDLGLADAAVNGIRALEREWNSIHPKYQKKLKPRLDQMHKPVAEMVDAKDGE